MPGMNGLELLARASEAAPDTTRVMLTGHGSLEVAAQAVNRGHVFQFLAKPCTSDALSRAVVAGVRQYHLLHDEREFLEKTIHGAVKVMSEIVAVVDPVAFGHCSHLRDEAHAMGAHLLAENTWEWEMAALLSQIGVVTLPPPLVKRARSGSQLSPEEQDLMNRIPEMGAQLVAPIARLENVARIIRYQCKNFDGTGIPPDTTRASGIPLGARLLRVLNEMLTIESKGVPRLRALEKMRLYREHYDWELIDRAAECFKDSVDVAVSGGARAMTLADLRPGMLLMTDVLTAEGMLVLPSGNKLNMVTLKKLMNFAEISPLREPIFVQ